ncbi:MAG: nucleoside-diphosphate sugar epimerase/dehydratase [Bacteroidota bacterium]|nr:nucleoside-diphosphate sugar epimerase/dehydratase [Bacteroidota bacterium]
MRANKSHFLLLNVLKYFKSTTPSWIIFNIDLFFSGISIFLAFFLRFNFVIPEYVTGRITGVLLLVIAIRALCFMLGKTHTRIVRHIGMRDLTQLALVVFIGSFLLWTANVFYNKFFDEGFFVPSSVIIIDFFITTYLMLVARLLIKFVFNIYRNNNKLRSNVIIIGSDELGIATKRALDLDTEKNYRVIAFLDEKKYKHRKNIDGIGIYPLSYIDDLLVNYSIDAVIIAKDYFSPSNKNVVVDKCLNYKVKVLTAPKIKSWIDGNFSTSQLKQINIEDLLSRDPIKLDTTRISEQLNGKNILITGAAGSIGSEIVRQVTHFAPANIILLDQAETPLYNIEMELNSKFLFSNYELIIGDITNVERMTQIFEQYPVDIIFHAAAYKHVPMMENNPVEAIHNNIIGTKIMADLAVKYQVKKFVMISTDKAVNPTNIMGASKRIAEMYTQALNRTSSTRFITTRFGNVLGSNGSAIPLFKKQIEEGGPVTVTHPEITRFFMTIPEACQLVLEAGTMGKGGEIFIFDMGKSIKMVDIVKNMIRLSGLEVDKDIKIKFVGLRPGEKLYEELLCKKENTLPTHNKKIMIAKVRDTDFETISQYIYQFEKLIRTQNRFEVVRLMKIIVPEYKSQNSVYETLDNVGQEANFAVN